MGRRIHAWLMPAEALARSHAQACHLQQWVRPQLDAARTARRLARVALPPDEPSESARHSIAALLLAEAVRRGTCALLDCASPGEAERALADLSPTELAVRVGGSENARVIGALFRRKSPPATKATPDPVARFVDPEGLRSAADRLIRDGAQRLGAHRRLLVALSFRWLLVALAVAAVTGAVLAASPIGREWRARNRLAHATWKASSADADRPVEGKMPPSGDPTFFMHTKLEDNPWIELEIPGGVARRISRVVVDNRSDCCYGRALPLVVEVSADHQSWTEVARRTKPFEDWTARFVSTAARWIRLRVSRRSILHLRDVAAF
jgi:hypothetical protein